MELRPSNPYYDMAAVRDPAMFFGRKHLLRRLYAAIAHRQCVSLVGPRHIGKSSILHCMCFPIIQEQFEEDLSRHIFIFLDLREYRNKSADDFFEVVSKQITAQCRGRLELVSMEGESEEEFSSILDQISEQGFHPVLLMDAFDTITRNPRFDLEFFAFLRAQARKVSYVTASIAPLSEVCHRDIQESPFFNIFGMYTVGPLDRNETCELVSIPAQSAGLPFTREEKEWLLLQAGLHPFFVQRVCHYLFEEKLIHNGSPVSHNHVKSLAYNELLPHFEDTWERLSEKQKEMLRNEAQRKGLRDRELPELSESGLFRKFVRDTCQLPLFRMKAEDVESVLDKLDDPRFLGDSDLKHLKTVSMHIKQDSMTSQIERGMAVREVLNDALERLRGTGIRRDTAHDWRLYNILHYRYFKNHLKNDQIAARLEFTSIRQYFRERNKAIEALFTTLLEMETSASGGEDD